MMFLSVEISLGSGGSPKRWQSGISLCSRQGAENAGQCAVVHQQCRTFDLWRQIAVPVRWICTVQRSKPCLFQRDG